MTTQNTHSLLLPAEAARLLDRSLPTVYRYCSERLLSAVRVGGAIRVRRDSVIRLLAEATADE